MDLRKLFTAAAMACVVFLSFSARGQALDYSMGAYRPTIRALNDNLLGTIVAGRDDGLRVLVVALVGVDLDAVPLLVDGSSARGTAQSVAFESPDCVGEPLFFPRSEAGAPLSVFLASVVLRNRPGMPAYLERQEEPVLRTVRSGYTQEGVCSNGNPIQLRFVMMKAVSLSLSDFPPPYQFTPALPPP